MYNKTETGLWEENQCLKWQMDLHGFHTAEEM